MQQQAPLLSARGIGKTFSGVEVLRDVDVDLMPGEIHALLGENGAGKSTFAKILAGVHRPSAGTLALAVTEANREARALYQALGFHRIGSYAYWTR